MVNLLTVAKIGRIRRTNGQTDTVIFHENGENLITYLDMLCSSRRDQVRGFGNHNFDQAIILPVDSVPTEATLGDYSLKHLLRIQLENHI